MALTAREYGGTITTIEFDPAAAAQAKINFIRSGVDSTIQILEGDACQIVPDLPDASFDSIFQDADKRIYPSLLQDCIRILRPGGILAVDDALFPVMDLDPNWGDQVEAVHIFNHLVTDSPELSSTLLPIGDGIVVAIKK